MGRVGMAFYYSHKDAKRRRHHDRTLENLWQELLYQVQDILVQFLWEINVLSQLCRHLLYFTLVRHLIMDDDVFIPIQI